MGAGKLLSLFTVWVVAAGPTLCVGGWVDHACADVMHDGSFSGADEYPAPSTDREHPDECNHESNCPADPCLRLIRPDDNRLVQINPVPDQPVEFVCSDDHTVHDPAGFSPQIRTREAGSHHSRGRPYFDRDLPLLI